MSRITIDSTLSELKTLLAENYSIDASVRYVRIDELNGTSSAPRYYVEPGTFTASRSNVASPSVKQTVRILAEAVVDYANLETAFREATALFEGLARDLLREPRLSNGAFLASATTFADAPTFVSSATVDDGYSAVFAGVELTYEF